jgi:leucyl-tRNA synthetase
MGKSLKNGVSPDEIYSSYGADTLRLYEMAMGPLDGDRPWRADDITGMHRFLQRLWRLIIDETTGEARVPSTAPAPSGRVPSARAPSGRVPSGRVPSAPVPSGRAPSAPVPSAPVVPQPDPSASTESLDPVTSRMLHQTIAAVRKDFAALRYHTAIARIVELTAHASRLPSVPPALTEPLVLMVAPLAPHIAEELWQRLGHQDSLVREPFPEADPVLAGPASVTLPVQVNGKVRFTVEVPADATRDDIAEALNRHPAYPREAIARLVIVPGKIANVVLR